MARQNHTSETNYGVEGHLHQNGGKMLEQKPFLTELRWERGLEVSKKTNIGAD